MISTRGRYALSVMIDLAEHQTDGYIPLKEIAERHELSEKYLENILKTLVQNKLRISPDPVTGRVYRGKYSASDRGRHGSGGLSGKRRSALSPGGKLPHPSRVEKV